MRKARPNPVESLIEPIDAIDDGLVALVGVTDEGLRAVATALGGIEKMQGRPGDPGPPGKDGIGRPGKDGRDGTDAPRPVRVVAERDFTERLTGAMQVLSDGSARHFDARRDGRGRIAEFVLTPGQEA